MSKKIAHLGTVTLDTKLATSKQLNADEILANGEDVAEMFSREQTYREMTSRVKLQPEDNYILYGNDGKVVSANLSGVQNGTRLFSNQTKLTEIPLSWKLDYIMDGTSMCESCTNLTTFSFPLNSLSNGSEMFSGCNLNEKSVENILKTIPIYSSGTHALTLNMSADAFEKFNEITENYLMAPGTISYKGWELTSNAVITIPVEELTAAIEEIVGKGKVIVGTIPTENKVVVHTDRVDDNQLEIVTMLLERVLPQGVEVVRYNHGMEISWQDAENKYAACQTVYDMLAVNPDYKNDLTSNGEWVYRLPEMTDIGHFDNTMETALFVRNNKIVSCSLSLPKNTDTTSAFRMCKNLQYLTLYTPECTDSKAMIFDSPALVELDLFAPKSTTRGNGLYNIALNSLRKMRVVLKEATWPGRNVPVLEELHIEAASICTVSTQGFPLSVLNAESAAQVMNSLAVTRIDGTHNVNFTLGIHIDHQNDEGVLAAIAAAEAHGWVMVIQWNGTPSAQASVTYGLRKPPIYARVGEIELPDGTVERVLDWGHYVTDPTGYKEFANQVEAREYYGLSSENIEEEELTNV